MSAISNCRICGESNLSTFLELGTLPHSDGLLREEDLEKPEPKYPLDVVFCENCSLVQILHTVPPSELFGDDYPYFSSFIDALLVHSRKNVHEIIETRGLTEDSFVIELASNDGYLLQYYKEKGISVQGIDPAKGPVEAAREKGIPTIQEFFSLELAEKLAAEGMQADVIHGNNVLAHVPDTNGFVAGIAKLLKEDGTAVIEAPYVKDLIEHCEFDTIYHQHLCYFSMTAVNELCRRNGLFLNHIVHLDIHGGSMRMFIGKQEKVSDEVKNTLAEEKALGLTELAYYQDFSARVAAVGAGLRAMLTELKSRGKSIVGYGAAAKGAIMMNYAGVGTETLEFVADKNVHKQGRFTPGLHVPIVDPARILEMQPDYVLILPWNFKEEIMSQQSEYRKRGGKFIIPIPFPHIA